MRLTEAEAAALARDVLRLIAPTGRAAAREVLVVVPRHPISVVAQVLELRLAAVAPADLVVLGMLGAVLGTERLAAVHALPDRPRVTSAAE